MARALNQEGQVSQTSLGENKNSSHIRFEWEREFRSALLEANPKLTGMILATFTDPRGAAFPSVSLLAELTSFSPRTVKRHLVLLDAAGWITRQKRGGHQSSIYRLVIPVQIYEAPEVPSSVTAELLEVPSSVTSVIKADGDKDVSANFFVESAVTPGVTSGVQSFEFRGDKNDRLCDPEVTFANLEVTPSVTQTLKNNELRTPLGALNPTNPPKGVLSHNWKEMCSIIGEVISHVGSDGPRIIEDWAQLTAQKQLCAEVIALLRSGKSHRAVVDLLAEGGYSGASHPARALYARAREARMRISTTDTTELYDFESSIVFSQLLKAFETKREQYLPEAQLV